MEGGFSAPRRHDALTFSDGNNSVTTNGNANTIKVGNGANTIVGFDHDYYGVIDLLNHAGGFTTPDAAVAALKSDGHGGSLLWLGAAGSINIPECRAVAAQVDEFQDWVSGWESESAGRPAGVILWYGGVAVRSKATRPNQRETRPSPGRNGAPAWCFQ